MKIPIMKKEADNHQNFHQFGFFDYDKNGNVDPYIRKRIEDESNMAKTIEKEKKDDEKEDPDIPF